MKKLLTGILAMLTCFSCLAATGCDLPFFGGDKGNESGTQVEFDLEGAADNLYSMYVADHAETSEDYYVVNTVLYDELYYNVAWSVDVTQGVTLEVATGDYEGMTKVNVDELTTADIEYVLTASITYEDSEAKIVTFNRTVVSIVDPNALSKPVENTAYYMYLKQNNAAVNKTLYVTGEMDSQNKYLDMTADPEEAKEVYVEVATGGYKFYVLNNETKSYIKLTQSGPNDKGNYSASVSWATDGSIFYYNPLGCWACDLANDTFFIGTFSNYETISASSDYYMTDKNGNSLIGTEQYPALLMLPEDVPEISAGEKLAKEEENLSTYLEIYENGEIALATAGKDYSDVVISWTSSNTTIAAVDGGKVTYTLPTDADATVKLTATLSIEGVDPVTKEFSVVVKKVGSAIPVANMPYLLYSTVSAGTNYFSGSLEEGRVTGTTTKTGAVSIYFEETTTAKEYYIYFMDGETKTYIYAAKNQSAGFAFSTTTPNDVWVVDLLAKTISSKTTTRFIATQVASTYQTFNTYAANNYGTAEYQAAWLEPVPTYAVTLKDGETTVDTLSFAADVAITLPTPTKEGYTFAKWVKEDGTDAPATMPAEDITLKATWTVNEYTLTIKGVGEADIVIPFGAETTDTISHTTADLADLLAQNLPANHNWDKEVPTTFALQDYTFTATEKPTHTLTLSKDGDDSTTQVAEGATLDAQVLGTNPTKEGYTFVKWAQEDGTDAPATMPTSDLTLFATWDLTVYTVTITGSVETITFAIVADEAKNAIALADVATKVNEILETERASAAAGITLSYKEVPEKFVLADTKLEIVKTATTIPAALNVADGTDVVVSGTVCEVNAAWSTQYKNMEVTITDSDGNKLYVYRLATEVELGDIITVTGKMGSYNGAKQVAAGATATIDGHDNSYDYVEMTITEALAAEKGTNVIVTGTVVKIGTAYSSQYNNISVYIADENGTQLYLYRLTGDVTVGKIIKVKGTMDSYNGSIQLAGGTFETVGDHTCSNYTEATCKDPATCKVCGAAKDDILSTEHNYADATCTLPKTCNVCGETTGEAAGHKYVEGVCSVCSAQEGAVEVKANYADFDTLNTEGKYAERTTTSGWVAQNAQVHGGGTSNDTNKVTFIALGDTNTKGVCLNGKTSAVGTLVSPTLSGGISKLTFNYGNMFSENNGVSLTINIKVNGETVETKQLVKANSEVTKFKACTFEWELDEAVEGDFTIEIVNNSPSNTDGNKDRCTIWNLAWYNA